MKITKKIVTEFLPHDMWCGFKWIIPFVMPFIKKYNIKPNDHCWYQSGGGCCHYFIRDENNHIYSFHAESEIVEKSYNTWEGDNWSDDYLDDDDYQNDSIKDSKYPFGWESESPNYFPQWMIDAKDESKGKDGDRWWRFENLNSKAHHKLMEQGVSWLKFK